MSDESAIRRAILQARCGPMIFRKAILEPNEILRVGKDKTMGLALPHDSQMAGAHFELAWDGSKCRIRDLKTMPGTLLDGRPIKTSIAPHGSWIRAGGTDFVLYVERHTPPDAATNEAESPHSVERKNHVLSILRAQENLYALLDPACSRRILTLLNESVEEHHSLYEGLQSAVLADVAPYIVRLPKGSILLESLVREGWGNHYSLYFTSKLPLLEVRRHLRKFLIIQLEGHDGRFYFRFYDPRVLRGFLPVCSALQLKEFFGPLDCFFYEDAEGELRDLRAEHPA